MLGIFFVLFFHSKYDAGGSVIKREGGYLLFVSKAAGP